MKNREVYLCDPSTRKLVNEGVASVNDDPSEEALRVLRYELETFVCDGQYAKGMEHILETFLKNIDQSQQPAVWVSGFYGSGKSHLVKMLRALWMDTKFSDGATARGIANLPENIRDLLKELSTQGKRYGGLQAASGTLGAGASGSVRLALLGIIFRSVGLPEQYPIARFVLWLKSEGIYEKVRNHVEDSGNSWQEELDNFHVAEGLYQALCKVKPAVFSSSLPAVEIMPKLYPNVTDVSNDQMVKAITQAVSKNGKFPLMLVVLDEVQQFIGENNQRSNDVQETVEACCKNVGGKLLFIGTGQTAVTGTYNLKKLEGRFAVRLELSDSDVDVVIRRVILAKKPSVLESVNQVMQSNQGEISRHLAGTTIGYRPEDSSFFAQDYPILPERRRFWEYALRSLDETGTDSQLRNQLSLVHKVIQTNLDDEIGNVIPADYLYFEGGERLLQFRTLPRNVYDRTMKWIRGSEEEVLVARACAIVFLVNKLTDTNRELGIRANVDTIADLMVTDLSAGSSELRKTLPVLLDECEILMKVSDQYRIQTEESAAWRDEFLRQRGYLANEVHRLETERNDRIRRRVAELVNKMSEQQGKYKVKREFFTTFDTDLPPDSDKKVYVWIRDGWNTDENTVRVDARRAGNQSPVVFVFVPKRSADDLRHYLMDYKAAAATTEIKGTPTPGEGAEARAAMLTTEKTAEAKINELLDEAFSGARVFQGGGNEIAGTGFQEVIRQAARNALERLYPKFQLADHPGWEKVYIRAKQGAPDALKAVGDEGEPANNTVCKAILAFIAGGKKGTEIRGYFEGPPYGWPGDAVDGALEVLLVAQLIRAQDEGGRAVEPRELERKALGKATFKIESATVSTTQRIQVRKLLQKMGCSFKQGEEGMAVPEFLRRLQELSDRAGGEGPKPVRPDTSLLQDVRCTVGNEQILALYNCHEELTKQIEEWNGRGNKIESRWPTWDNVRALLNHATDLESTQEVRQQALTIETRRLLLAEPDPAYPLLQSLESSLRKELMEQVHRYGHELVHQKEQLFRDVSWCKIASDEQERILLKCGITEAPEVTVGTIEELKVALTRYPIRGWYDRIDALPSRFARAREMAMKILEPEIQSVEVPRRTLKSSEDIARWLNDVEKQLQNALHKGPVVIR